MSPHGGFGDFQQNQVIGDFLLRENVITATDLNRAIEHQSIINARLDTAILDLGLVRDHKLLESLGKLYRSPTVSGVQLELIQPSVSRLIAPRMASRYKIVPFKKDGNRISVAAMSRTDLLLEDELRMLTGCVITTHVTLEVFLTEALAAHYGIERTLVMRMLSQRLRNTARISSRETPPPHNAPPTPPPKPSQPPRLKASPVPESQPATAPAAQQINEIELTEDEYDLLALSRDDDSTEQASAVFDYSLTADPIPDSPPRDNSPPEEQQEDSTELRLTRAADRLKNAEMREDIGDAILEFCEPHFQRRMLLVRRGDTIMGWRGAGKNVDELAVRAISIPVSEPSVFIGLGESVKFWMGPLPPLTRNIDLVLGLGSDQPKDCIILPVKVKNKVIAYLYVDNMDRPVAGAPLADLQRLMVKVGIAFQVYILKSKIHLA